MSKPSLFLKRSEAKEAGFYSRRHQNSQPHEAAVAQYVAKQDLRRKKAEQRAFVCRNLGPQERLARLDMRFGAGQGAKKERARLHETIAFMAICVANTPEARETAQQKWVEAKNARRAAALAAQ